MHDTGDWGQSGGAGEGADPEPRVIRVFVSSTFRDMQAEREELVKRTFPEVRRRCEERGVTFAEIDLRWGVTDEQKAEGAVLPICLREIELSRPWFIGLLGDRYGWVPDEIPGDLATRLGWLTDDPGRSVTEMEILHGVLNDAETGDRSFFYLRDPGWVGSLPEDVRGDFVDGDPALEARLDALKDRIRASGRPVRDYADPPTLAEQVRADLLGLVDRLYPADEEVTPLAAARAEHAAYAATRFDGYVERPADLAALDAHAEGDGPPLVVTGESGSGKSALVANWVRRQAGGGAVPVIEHYTGASSRSSDWRALAARLIGEVEAIVGHDLEVPTDDEALRVALARALHTLGSTGRAVVVIDGVDQVEVAEGTVPLHWLPTDLPVGVRLVVSAKPGPAADELARRGWPVHAVAPLTDAERSALIATFLGGYAKALGTEHTTQVLAAPQTANPLYLLALLDELRQHGDHFTLGALIADHLEAATVDDLYERILARWERDYERDRPGLVGDAFRAVWAARRGLTEVELLDVLGGPDPDVVLPRAVWSPLFLAAERSLVTRSGTVTFFHAYLRDAVRDRYLAVEDERRRAHATLAGYFADRPVNRRTIDELPWQQAEAGDWDGLAATLARPEVLTLAHESNRFDLRSLWVRLEAASAHRMVEVYEPLLAQGAAADPDAAWALARLLADAGHAPESIRVHRSILERAAADGHDERRRAALLNLGAALLATDDLAGAGAAFDELQRLATDAGDHAMVRRALSNRANVLRARGEGAAALAILADEERLCREAGDVAGLQVCVANQGGILDDRGDFTAAMAKFTEQESLARQLGDPELIGKALGGQATVLAAWARWAESDQRYDEWAACCRQVGDRASLQVVLGNQAVSLMQQGRLDDAGSKAAEAARICRDIASTSGLARAQLIDAMIRHRRGDLDGSLAVLDEHRLAVEAIEDRNGLALNLGERATILRERGDLDGAMAAHLEEERIYESIGSATGVATSLGNQANVHLARGDAATALALFQQLEARWRDIGDPSNLQVVLGNHGAVLLQTGDLAGAWAVIAEQERIAREASIPAGVAAARGNMGLIRFQQGDLAGAAADFAEQERICTETADANGLQTCLGNQAALAVQQNDGPRALALMDRQVTICRASGLLEPLQKALGFIAEIKSSTGDALGALAAATEVAQVAATLGNEPARLQAVGATAQLLMHLQRFDEALVAYADLAAGTTDPATKQMALEQQALIQMQRLDWHEVARLLAEQEAIVRPLGDNNALQSCIGNQAIAKRNLGDLPGALAAVEEQARLCQQVGNQQGLLIATANRGELLCNVPGRLEEGLAVLADAQAMATRMGAAQMAQQIARLAQQLRGQAN